MIVWLPGMPSSVEICCKGSFGTLEIPTEVRSTIPSGLPPIPSPSGAIAVVLCTLPFRFLPSVPLRTFLTAKVAHWSPGGRGGARLLPAFGEVHFPTAVRGQCRLALQEVEVLLPHRHHGCAKPASSRNVTVLPPCLSHCLGCCGCPSRAQISTKLILPTRICLLCAPICPQAHVVAHFARKLTIAVGTGAHRGGSGRVAG